MGGCEDVGVAGFTLGGGQGLLAGRYGTGCDNLVSVEVVTADGRLVTASKKNNEDLFWGMLGGAGNFGVATMLEYRLYPVTTIFGGTLVYPIRQAKQVLDAWRDYTSVAPDELTTFLGMTMLPDGPVLGIVACYCGDLHRGEEVLRPLASFGSLLTNSLGPTPYLDFQHSMEVMNPSGSFSLSEEQLLQGVKRREHRCRRRLYRAQSLLLLRWGVPLHGRRLPGWRERNRVFDQTTRLEVAIDAYWREPWEAQSSLAWANGFWNAMRPFTTSAVYVNNLSDEGEDRARAAYGVNYPRLVALKNKYDPTNFFRMNQNIRPTV